MVGRARVRLHAHDLPEAFEAAFSELPHLRVHLTLESGELRPHVFGTLNGEHVPRDEIWIHRRSRGARCES